MLTADLAQSWQRNGRVFPKLVEADDATLLQTAAELIGIVRDNYERSRADLEAALDAYVGTGTDYRILRGLIKLLTDVCTFETQSRHEPSEIRQKVFLQARARHPISSSNTQDETSLIENARAAVLAEVARQLACSVDEIEQGLYADLSSAQRLVMFDEPDAASLLERYNLAQAQAVLYRAVEMRLSVAPQEAVHARAIFDAIKAYGLVHTIAGSAHAGYEVTLTGPVSMFHRSQKYGIQMAVFLPALLLCRGWYMRAEIAAKNKDDRHTKPHANLIYELNHAQDDLHSHLLPAPRVSHELPEKLLTTWERGGGAWTLAPSVEVIDLGASAFVPDLVAEHIGGKRVYIEVFGFWTPAHLAARIKDFERERFSDWLIVATDELRCSRDPAAIASPHVLICKATLDAALVRLKLDEAAGLETPFDVPAAKKKKGGSRKKTSTPKS
ncbi:MAG: DUF790 family protein [Pyrinomonadaceae bacterium MAG19_C2-C3]|nr:DUF790 family protein [Pyrinomonadaceae bacterium MAG19_C2-C3]